MPNTLAKLFQSNSSVRKYEPCVIAKVRETYGDLQSKFRSPKLNLPRGWLSSHSTFFPRLQKQTSSIDEGRAKSVVNSLLWAKVCFSFLLSRLLLPFLFHSSLFPAFTGCSEKSIFSFMWQPVHMKPCLITACTGKAWVHYWCLTRSSAGCMCMVCPCMSVKKHVLKVGARKMGYAIEMYSIVTSSGRVQDIWQNHFEGEAGDFVGTARLPQEQTDQVVRWADESPHPSFIHHW